MNQQFVFRDKDGRDLQVVTDMGQVAALLQDEEFVNPMDGASLERYLITHHMKVKIDGVEYIHKGCSWGICEPELYVYKQIS